MKFETILSLDNNNFKMGGGGGGGNIIYGPKCFLKYTLDTIIWHP